MVSLAMQYAMLLNGWLQLSSHSRLFDMELLEGADWLHFARKEWPTDPTVPRQNRGNVMPLTLWSRRWAQSRCENIPTLNALMMEMKSRWDELIGLDYDSSMIRVHSFVQWRFEQSGVLKNSKHVNSNKTNKTPKGQHQDKTSVVGSPQTPPWLVGPGWKTGSIMNWHNSKKWQ